MPDVSFFQNNINNRVIEIVICIQQKHGTNTKKRKKRKREIINIWTSTNFPKKFAR